jgi:hypothetical protein
VQKVIELLEENKVKITNDLAAEEKEMTAYTEFCDKESSEKGYAIETATRTLEFGGHHHRLREQDSST